MISGAVGVVVALVVTLLMERDAISGDLAVALWPSGMVGLIDPVTWLSKLLTGVMMYGGQFLIYGALGLVLGGAVHMARVLVLWR